MKNRLAVFTIICVLPCLMLASCLAQHPVFPPDVLPDKPLAVPQRDVVWTATRQINCLTIVHDGTVWAGTAGGVLHRQADGKWQKWTRADGLPSHEIRAISEKGGIVRAVTPRGAAVWKAGQWQPAAKIADDSLSLGSQPQVQTNWRGRVYTATPAEFRVGVGKNSVSIALPPSTGTHISALLPRRAALWAAMYGDGLWAYNGQKWQRAPVTVPAAAREITALAAPATEGTTLWLGTRRAGVWFYNGKAWSQFLQKGEPFDHNIEALAEGGGGLFCSTLEDGLGTWDGKNWTRVPSAALSSDAPRQIVRFGGALWVRHGGGQIDRFNGKGWQRNVFPQLPRGKVLALAADASRLYLVQWGGWSEWDGNGLTHFLDLPELQGLPLMTLLPDGDTTWIGTQSRGVAQFKRATRTVMWHDERAGLPDDWITSIARAGGHIYAGTFVGGLARMEEEGKWVVYPELKGQNVTALEPDEAGGLFVATRSGVWHIAADGKTITPLQTLFLDPEVQALHLVPGGLYVGARTGLSFVRIDRRD